MREPNGADVELGFVEEEPAPGKVVMHTAEELQRLVSWLAWKHGYLLILVQVEVRKLFVAVFKKKREQDFSTHVPADLTAVRAYEVDNQNPGPNMNYLQLDMRNGPWSRWNEAASRLLLDRLIAMSGRLSVPDDERKLYADLIRAKIVRCRVAHRRILPRLLPGAVAEDSRQSSRRVQEKDADKVWKARHNKRRLTVSLTCPAR